jgi:putative endopeptidase
MAASKYIENSSAKGPRVPSVDPHYSPAENFYMYVNARWQKSVKMPSYEDDYGISEEIEQNLRKVLQHALSAHLESHPSDGLSQLAQSFLNPAVQTSGIDDLMHALNALDCIDSPKTLGHAIGRMNRIQSRAPFSFVVNSDYYDSKKCCVYLYETMLGLPSKHNYEATASNRVLSAYRRYLSRMGELLHIEGLETSITTESEFIPVLSEMSELRDVSYLYNAYSLGELEKKYSAIPWRSAIASWGLHDVNGTQFIVTNTRFFKMLNSLFESEEYGKIRLWFKSMMVNHYAKYLPPPFDDLHYALFDKLIKGVDKKLPQTNLTLKVLMTFAQQDLSRMFVTLAVHDSTKRLATEYIKMLKAATARRIRGLKWMENSTKNAALRKIGAMTFQVAYPEKWRSETDAVEIDRTRPFQNLVALASADTDAMIHDLRTHKCYKRPSHWREGAFEVNAYYYPEGNMMVVPAGILRPPFFDLDRSDAWNLGGIGVAISHEITHGFDDDGRVFDEDGNYKDWWKPNDERTYKAMSRDVVKLFDGQKYMGGVVDGKKTLNENLADLGGMAIALDALNSMLPSDPAKRKAAYRDFFISFAVSWRQKDRPKKARQALLLDVHAPTLYRVNLIVRQFEEFYTAFDITAEDKGYVPREERIVFW